MNETEFTIMCDRMCAKSATMTEMEIYKQTAENCITIYRARRRKDCQDRKGKKKGVRDGGGKDGEIAK